MLTGRRQTSFHFKSASYRRLWLSADQNWVDPGWSQSIAQRPDQQEENSCGGERLFGSNFSVDNFPSRQPC